MSDSVTHPPHYNTGKIEVMEFIEDQGYGEGFSIGNAIKYACRAGKKDPGKTIEDLEKAVWYLNRRIELLKAAKEERLPLRPNDMNPRKNALSDSEGKAIVKGAEGFFSAMTAKVPVPEHPPGFSFEASNLRWPDMIIHGTWFLITPEGQEETVAFIPDRCSDWGLHWLSNKRAIVKLWIDDEQEG